jgi:hypothetical protein
MERSIREGREGVSRNGYKSVGREHPLANQSASLITRDDMILAVGWSNRAGRQGGCGLRLRRGEREDKKGRSDIDR